MSEARDRWFRRTRTAATSNPASADSATTQSAVVAPSPRMPLGSGESTTGGAASSGGGTAIQGDELDESSAAADGAPNAAASATTIRLRNTANATRRETATRDRAGERANDAADIRRQRGRRGERRRGLHPLSTLAYVITGAVLLALSLGIGTALYATTTVPYTASCVFRVSFPLAQQTGPDFFAANQYLATAEVGYGRLDGVYQDATGTAGTDATAVRDAAVVLPTSPNDFTTVTAKAPAAASAAASANALCTNYVKHITAQRAAMRQSEVDDLRQRISDLNQRVATLTANGPPTEAADKVQLDGLQAAITRAGTVLATALSRPPESVDVVALSPHGVRVDHRNLSANLFYAGGAAILVTFLIVLVCEVSGSEQLTRALRLRWVPR